MNDRWFNFAMSVTIITMLIGGFIGMAGMQPDAQGNKIPLFSGMDNTALSYSNVKSNSNFNVGVNISSNGDSSSSPTSDQGFTPVTTSTGDIFAWKTLFDLVVNTAAGFELLMLKLAGIFTYISPLFVALAGIGFLAKIIMIMWASSVVLRPLTGRVW